MSYYSEVPALPGAGFQVAREIAERADAEIAELRRALLIIRRWCIGNSYSASVQVAMQQWIDAGMIGPAPKLHLQGPDAISKALFEHENRMRALEGIRAQLAEVWQAVEDKFPDKR